MKTIVIDNLLETKLKSIARVIEEKYTDELQVGVLAGASGLSLFEFHYQKRNNICSSAMGLDMLEYSINKVNTLKQPVTFCSGISGLGWTLDYLALEGFIDNDIDQLVTPLDSLIQRSLSIDLKRGNYDFLHGAIGHALYFLNRYRNTKSDKLKSQYRENLLEFICQMQAISEKIESNKRRWPQKKMNGWPGRIIDLGLSHGMASIISILSHLYEFSEFKPHVDYLLLESIECLISYQKIENNSSIYPVTASLDQEEKRPCRLSWCYGDLGIGIALWNASKILASESLKNNALNVLTFCAHRKSETGVMDASICHGSFGMAHIFNKLFQETDDLVFKDASTYWALDGLAKGSFKDGYAGFKQWNTSTHSWYRTTSLLEGISGIGLVIMNLLDQHDSNWDKCLLIS